MFNKTYFLILTYFLVLGSFLACFFFFPMVDFKVFHILICFWHFLNSKKF